MKSIKYFLCLFALFLTTFSAYADPSSPGKDQLLIEKLKEQKVRLIILRHGESTNTLKNTVVSSNSPGIFLTDNGIAQTTVLANQLVGENVETVYCSPLFRTQQAASILKNVLGLRYRAILIDNRLTLQSFGTYEGQDYRVFTAYFPSFDRIFIDAVPGGELGTDVFKRLHSFLWDVAIANSNATVVIVTHAFNCNHINMLLTGKYGKLLSSGTYTVYDYE